MSDLARATAVLWAGVITVAFTLWGVETAINKVATAIDSAADACTVEP